MTVKYYALLTNLGAAKLANAAALGTKLQITQMAVGDGGGTLPTPNASQTKLIGEQRRAPLNQLSVDTANSSQIIAEQIIPETDGGFWIREIGLFDADGVLIAVANCAETYKPQLQEGSGRTQTVRMIIIVSSTDAVTLKIDPSVVLATRKYVDDALIEVKAYSDKLISDHVAAKNPHAQYLKITSALSEIKDAGRVADALDNLGLGEDKGRFSAGFFPSATAALDVTTDLNTLKTPGSYYQTYLLQATLARNYPVAGICGTINVYRNAANGIDGCAQEFIRFDTGAAYRRVYDAARDTWTTWYRDTNMVDFTASLGANGWQKLPSGLILQWGGSGRTGASRPTTFPIAFPNACVRVFVGDGGWDPTNSAKSTWGFTNATNTGVNICAGLTSEGDCYWALGY
ncbi:phage tail protein [Erwinia billingiae]|uniref:phage tail-collar fiber domain-containing protein n=1 Tax=Erwinia billingiae TaxID=182337 RepID=UPI0009E55079|nr:phage tail protein [Erwinia billingiae]